MAEEKTLGQTIIECIEKHGKCVVVSHPEDAALIDLLRNMPITREALDLATIGGLIEWKESAYLRRHQCAVMAPGFIDPVDADFRLPGGTHA